MTKANIKDLETLIETIVHEALMKESDSLADDPLVTAFISPFTDIIKTAKGEIEKTAAVSAYLRGGCRLAFYLIL